MPLSFVMLVVDCGFDSYEVTKQSPLELKELIPGQVSVSPTGAVDLKLRSLK